MLFSFYPKGRETEILAVGIRSPYTHDGQDWVGLKPGPRNSVWVSHEGSRDPRTRAITHCLPRRVAGSWIKRRSQDPNQAVASTTGPGSCPGLWSPSLLPGPGEEVGRDLS